eukprot:CAMPEP_0201555558 /NCGR_PEP_ID=MMETSP0173_2-20130828/49802_1 /ASSEMBLY_ACC=CAM_ASM_000268 /TAXON_ID=218659 /ORGANISM="Vexillifera sp., Strain DIVA3 564/2" /LENGTH=73 /DNA_ID=CAMNT_0047967413 /DNA_START=44 /DNA_END=262 /DNA_ORIENTATION=-
MLRAHCGDDFVPLPTTDDHQYNNNNKNDEDETTPTYCKELAFKIQKLTEKSLAAKKGHEQDRAHAQPIEDQLS